MAFLQILLLSFVFLLCHINLCVNAGITIVSPAQNLTKPLSASALPAAGTPRLDEASAGRALPGNIPDDLSVFSNGRKAILNVLQCLFQKEDRAQCFFDRAQRALDEQRSKLLAQADAEVDRYYSLKTGGRAKSEDKPTSVSHSVTQIITELTDMLSDSFGTFFNNKEDTTGTKDVNTITDELDEDEEEDEDIDTNDASEDGSTGVAERTSKAVSRKKKKKGKIHKLIALIKLLVTGAVLKALLDTVLNLISTHLQKKFFFIAVVGLLLNLARFWFDAKKLHQPQKVIYYEHAQHQHHYEHPEDHHHGSGSFWGRSLDIKLPSVTTTTTQETAHNIVYNAHIPL